MTPETALPGTTSGERRRAAHGARRAGAGLGSGRTVGRRHRAAALGCAARAVLWAQAEWERAVEHAAGMDEVTAHLAQLCAAIRQQASGQNPDLAALPRNALSRRLVGLIRAAFLDRAQALPAARRRPAAAHARRASSRWASASRRTGRSTSPTGCPGPMGSSWWSRWRTTSAPRSPRSSSSPRPCSGPAAARSIRCRSASWA